MEIVETKKWHSIELTGKWELNYKVTNRMGPEAFGGKHLPAYPNPFTREKTYLKGPDNEPRSGWMMDKIKFRFDLDQNPHDKNLISWLICHPEVRVEGVKGLDPVIIASKKATKVTLTCKDFVQMSEIDEGDYIDRIVGRLSLDGGKQAIGLKRIRYIMARVGLNYRVPRLANNEQAEKKYLRTELKNWVRKSYANAKIVGKAIEDESTSKDVFEFKEMLRNKVIIRSNGMYKLGDVPLGIDYDSVQLFFNNHPDMRMEANRKLYETLD